MRLSQAAGSSTVPPGGLAALERRAPSGKVEAHLLPDAALSLSSSGEATVGEGGGEVPQAGQGEEAAAEVEVVVVEDSTGGYPYRYQSDKAVARTHAFDDALTRTGERLAERFGFPGMGSMHVHGEKLYCVARVCVKAGSGESSIDELGVYVQSTVGSGQPRTRYALSPASWAIHKIGLARAWSIATSFSCVFIHRCMICPLTRELCTQARSSDD
jgi:hypothetical protein